MNTESHGWKAWMIVLREGEVPPEPQTRIPLLGLCSERWMARISRLPAQAVPARFAGRSG
jgi:hypothetical protein